MNHCQEYWKLAEEVSRAFQFAEQEASSTVASPERDERRSALHSRYIAAIKRLDEHTVTCPCCRGAVVNRNRSIV